MRMTEGRRLVIVTPAYNEAETLQTLAESIDRQSTAPAKWIVVNDDSDDLTGPVARRLASTRPYMRVVDAGSNSDGVRRSFGRKVLAFEAGLATVSEHDYDLVGVLDADLVLPSDYYQRIVDAFGKESRLGLVGGRYRLPNGKLGRAGGNAVPGGAAVLRATAYRSIGGFELLANGGEDALLGYKLRARGWATRCLHDLVYEHSREMGRGDDRSVLATAYALGRRDWSLANPASFETLKLIEMAVTERPPLLFAAARALGYAKASMSERRDIDPLTVAHIRREQLGRLPGFRGVGGPSIPHPALSAEFGHRKIAPATRADSTIGNQTA